MLKREKHYRKENAASLIKIISETPIKGDTFYLTFKPLVKKMVYMYEFLFNRLLLLMSLQGYCVKFIVSDVISVHVIWKTEYLKVFFFIFNHFLCLSITRLGTHLYSVSKTNPKLKLLQKYIPFDVLLILVRRTH